MLLYEDDHILWRSEILTLRAPVHIVIIPENTFQSIMSVPARSRQLAGSIRLRTGIALREGIADTGFRLVNNCGEDGGQTVPHLHYHLLGDGIWRRVGRA